MPIYCYKCPDCDVREEVVRPMNRRNDGLQCPDCDILMTRDFASEQGSKKFAVGHRYFSSSMGVHPDQIQEEKKLHPDWNFDAQGRLEVNGYQDQKRKAKALGMSIG